MSFRKEEKIKIHSNQLLNLLDWINQQGGYLLFPSRIISSTYFDNDEIGMYKDSEEGCIPRKKIRIRNYTKSAHTQDNSSLETKISSVEGRFKTTSKNFSLSKAFSMGIFDKNYGICKPKVRVIYQRSYYKIHKVRLTIDENIEYSEMNHIQQTAYKKSDSDIIVEIKANNQVPMEYLLKKFPFERVRFSKYSRAINLFS